MSLKIKVGTRKGLFQVEQVSTGNWRIMPPAFLGDPVTMTLTDPASGDQFAALNLGHFGVKLFRAEPGSNDWQEITVPKYPMAEEEDGPAVQQIWEMVPGGPDRPGTLWAGTIPGGLFKSTDRGDSWALVESLWARTSSSALLNLAIQWGKFIKCGTLPKSGSMPHLASN